MSNIRSRLFYNQNWNIGFCELTQDEFIRNQKLATIQWMKHPYRDRWFADPYLLKITDTNIIVLVEECNIESPKGIICELLVDRITKRLKERHVLLELETHLSYPVIVRQGDKVYVYPENGASGKLNIYEYDGINHRLVNPVCILDEAVADANIVKKDNLYYMSATKYPQTQADSYLYVSDSLFGPFKQVCDKPFQKGKGYSRQGGDWLVNGDCFYRPVQDCRVRYGSSLNIMVAKISESEIKEEPLFNINPCCTQYSEGLHTINFFDGVCVIDSCGYL